MHVQCNRIQARTIRQAARQAGLPTIDHDSGGGGYNVRLEGERLLRVTLHRDRPIQIEGEPGTLGQVLDIVQRCRAA